MIVGFAAAVVAGVMANRLSIVPRMLVAVATGVVAGLATRFLFL